MADFAKWVTAAEQTLGWLQGSFVSAYSASCKEAEGAALECNAVASAILTMIQAQRHWEWITADFNTYLPKHYPGMPPLKWSTFWDRIIPFSGGRRNGWQAREARGNRAEAATS
jgi:hypothetical protein